MTEDADKSGVVEYSDGFLTYSYCGLAKADKFEMKRWVAEAICEAGRPGIGSLEALHSLVEMCTVKFRSLRVAQEVKATTVVFSGFIDDPDAGQVGLIAVVSNFEGLDGPTGSGVQESFMLCFDLVELKAAAIRQIGSGQIQPSDAQSIAELLTKGIHPEHAIRRAVLAVRDAAKRTKDGSVGGRCASIYLVRGFKESAIVDYHADLVSYDMYYPTFVSAKFDKEGAYIIGGGKASGFDNTGTAIASRVQVVGRNQPCPCKSGKKYKLCHGSPGDTDFGPTGANEVKAQFDFMVKEFGTVDIDIFSLRSMNKLPKRNLAADTDQTPG